MFTVQSSQQSYGGSSLGMNAEQNSSDANQKADTHFINPPRVEG